jgi:hypothetical protein
MIRGATSARGEPLTNKATRCAGSATATGRLVGPGLGQGVLTLLAATPCAARPSPRARPKPKVRPCGLSPGLLIVLIVLSFSS